MEIKQLMQSPEFYKEIALANRPYFANYYLNITSPPHQKEWHNILDDVKRNLLLAPRDHGKSLVVTYEFPIHEICKNRNIRILIISKTGKQGTKFLSVIKEELEQNQKLIKDFGVFYSDIGWTSNYIYVKRDKIMKDPTVECVGVLGAITGGHFDIIIADDILDDENTKTVERMKTVKNWFYGTIMQLVEPHTKVIVVGTRKHYLDLYQDILKNPMFKNSVYKAIIKYPDKYDYVKDDKGEVDVKIKGQSEVLWPDKWDIKTLLKDRHSTGSILFDREKQNDPSGMRGQLLKMEWLNFYKEPPTHFKYKFQGIDLAISTSLTADYFVICTIGVDDYNNIYVLDWFRGRLEFPQQVEAVIQYASLHKPLKIFIEKNQYQAALAQHLISFTDLPIIPTQTTKSKETRMIALSPYFQNGRIRLKESMHDFITEYSHFPKGAHDDMLDGLDLSMTDIKQSIVNKIVPLKTINIYNRRRT